MNPYHHGDLRRALISAALELVAEQGPKGFTLAEAARRAGVSTAAPYRHFASKDDLLAAVAVQGFNALHESLSRVYEKRTSDAGARLVALGREYVRFAVGHPAYYQVMFGTGNKRPEDDDWREAGEQAFSVLIAGIVDAQDAAVLETGDPLRHAAPIWALLHGVSSLYVGGDFGHVGINEPSEQLAERSIAALLESPASRP